MRVSVNPLPQSEKEDPDWITLLGPWMGEFGYELIYWQGFVRWYCENHSDEYVIVAGTQGHRVMYELADEYWEVLCDQPREPNAYLSGLSRIMYHEIARSLYEELLPNRMGVPDRLHEKGWIEFGNPKFNQSFKKLEPTARIRKETGELLKTPRVVIFPRCRDVDSQKNWSEKKWEDLGNLLQSWGLQVVVGGAPGGWSIANFLHGSDFEIDISDWLNLQLSLVCGAELVISGESGSGFLPGLCGVPGVIFGSERERERYLVRENIFRSRVEYIGQRDPSVEAVSNTIMGVLR